MNVGRNIWQTKTAKSASVGFIAGIVVLIGGNVFDIVKRHSKNPADVEDVKSIVMNIAGLLATGGAAGSILGRAAVGDVKSPGFMPGPNS